MSLEENLPSLKLSLVGWGTLTSGGSSPKVLNYVNLDLFGQVGFYKTFNISYWKLGLFKTLI